VARVETGRPGAGRERTRFGRLLIVAEVALAATLAVGAGLLVRSLGAMMDLDPGFRTSGLAAFRVGLPEQRYDTLEKTSRFFDHVLERTRALPGVESASAVGWLPLGGTWSCSFDVDGRPAEPGEADFMGLFRPVGTDYFRTMGIPLRSGRTFESADRAGSPPVIVIDEALAAKYFPATDPIGHKLRFHCGGGDGERTIVGVVGGVRQYQLTEELLPGYYIPYGQLYWDTMSVVMRTSADPAPLVDEVRLEIRRMDPELAVYGVETIEDRLARALARPRLQSLLFGAFAALALALGAAGVYGVMAYNVSRRKHEMGVRAAFGARAGDLVRRVLGEGMTLVAIGLAAGLLLALAASRLLEGLLFEVSATDPRAFAAAALVLGVAALLACWLPARRAGRVDVTRMLQVD
jgi:putative ABC transport system permease protein